MRVVLLRGLGVCALGALLGGMARASTLHGEVSSDDAATFSGLTAVLLSGSDAMPVARAWVAANGEFEMTGVATGSYRLRIVDGAGRLLREDFVSVTAGAVRVTIRLPRWDFGSPGKVSLASLKRKIPRAARREFQRAEKAERRGDVAGAIAHLRKAIEIEPRFMEAHNNLGARLMERGERELAAAEFRAAAELDPSAAPAFSNLGVTLLWLGKLEKAEKAARRAVEIDGASRKHRWVLGLILAHERNDAEALANLKAAREDYPEARLTIAAILLRQGKRAAAATELRAYLRGSAARFRPQAEAWLARIEPGAEREFR
jgi:tetratricopeptide (TPR) repeat protein